MSQDVRQSGGLYGAPEPPAEQQRAFADGEVRVAVYGLGKIGLPLASVFADVTGNTVGVDVDSTVVARVNDGDCPVEREPGLPALLEDLVDRQALRATTDGAEAAAAADVHVVVVPTVLADDREPDLSVLEEAVATVAEGLSAGDVVFVESTVPPRTTADVVVPHLADRSGLAVGDFGAAACPERTLSGRALADIRGTHPKVVGGVDPESTRVAELVYDELTANDVLAAESATMAEAVKVFEGVYRDVNIAVANQLARYAPALDVDVRRTIELANTQPFCDILEPGPGVGGHCIPVYPYFLRSVFDVRDDLLPAARRTNDAMPAHTVALFETVLEHHGRSLADSTVLLLGATYKANVNELRNAPALALADALADRCQRLLGADPLVDEWDRTEGVEQVPVGEAPSTNPDGVVLVTPHDEFLAYDWTAFDAPIIDGRAALDPDVIEAPIYTVGGQWP